MWWKVSTLGFIWYTFLLPLCPNVQIHILLFFANTFFNRYDTIKHSRVSSSGSTVKFMKTLALQPRCSTPSCESEPAPQLCPVLCLFRYKGKKAGEVIHPAVGVWVCASQPRTGLCPPPSCVYRGGGGGDLPHLRWDYGKRENTAIPLCEGLDMYPQGRHPVSSCLCHWKLMQVRRPSK